MPTDAYYRVRQRRLLRLLAIWVPVICCAWCIWWLPQPWNIAAGLGAGVGLLALFDSPTRQSVSWRSIAPGKRDLYGHASTQQRILEHAQTHPEGRDYWNVLLPDGAVLNGVAGPVHALCAGRWHIALEQTPAPQPLLVYDGRMQRLYAVTHPRTGLDAEAFLAHVLAHSDQADQLLHDACGHATRTAQLHCIHGLLFDQAISAAPQPVLARHLPDGALLEAHLLIPADLRAAADPLGLLALAPYRLTLDGIPAHLHVAGLDDLHASASGACWIARGMLLHGVRVRRHIWQIRHRSRWHAIDTTAWSGDRATTILMTPVSVSDDGALHFNLKTAGDVHSIVPSTVMLNASWRRQPLVLATENCAVTVQLPT